MSCKYNNCKICGYKTECEIYKENAELTKAYDETQELLDKQIEATYKLDKENAELKDNFKIAKDNEYEYSSLLIKAKELLKWALRSDPEHDEDFDQKWEKAEQFLNSEVEK